MIQLGRKVKDLVTGYVGVASGRSEWLYGCARIVVEGTETSDGKVPEPQYFDEQRIEHFDDGPPVLSVVEPPACHIKLGSKVKDVVTGYQGMAVVKTVWINGRISIGIEPTELKEGKVLETNGFDLERVQLIEEQKPPMSRQNSATSGGPQKDFSPSRTPGKAVLR